MLEGEVNLDIIIFISLECSAFTVQGQQPVTSTLKHKHMLLTEAPMNPRKFTLIIPLRR